VLQNRTTNLLPTRGRKIVDTEIKLGQRPELVTSKQPSETSRIVDRALAMLEWLARNPGAHGVREIARALTMTKSTAHRLLGTLTRRGWVRKAPGDLKYTIGLKVLSIGSVILNRTTFLEAAVPISRELARATGEAIYLGVQEGNDVVIIHKVGGAQAIRFDENVGTRAYLHTSAIGKAILAARDDAEVERILSETGLPRRTPATITDRARLFDELSKIRARGIAESNEENYVGALGVAATIYNQAGDVVGAITVAGLKSRMNSSRLKLARLVRVAANRISAELGFGVPAHSPVVKQTVLPGIVRGPAARAMKTHA